jgi:hypothetical protein
MWLFWFSSLKVASYDLFSKMIGYTSDPATL